MTSSNEATESKSNCAPVTEIEETMQARSDDCLGVDDDAEDVSDEDEDALSGQ